jgi:hypothetical protein
LLNLQASTPAIPRRLLWTWLALLALSQLAGLATTWRSLAVGLREDNPVVRAALHSGSFPLFALLKVVVLTFCVIALGNLISVLVT